MVDFHICDMERATHIPYKCGNCNNTFSTMCKLYEHFTSHDSVGSFHFDNLLKVGFPKYDSTCMATQTDISAIDELDVKALLLLKKYQHKHIPLISVLDRDKTEEENVDASGLTEKDIFKKSRVETVQQMAKKGRTINQKEEKLRDKITSVMKELSKQSDFTGSQQGTAKRSTSVIKRHRIKSQMATGSSNEEDIKNANNKNSGKVPRKDESATTVLETSNKEREEIFVDQQESNNYQVPEMVLEKDKADRLQETMSVSKVGVGSLTEVKRKIKKTDNNSIMEEELPKPAEFKETNLEEEGTSSSSSKYEIHSSNPTLPFYEMANKKHDIVKVSQTWTPAIDVAGWVQQRQMESGSLSQFPVAVIPIENNQSTENNQPQTETSEKKSNTTVCEVCGKRVGKYGYKDHLNTHFGRTPYVCELCGKAVTSKKALDMHKLCSHLEEALKKQCKYCDKKFPTKTRLEEHKVTHFKDKEFVCVKCGKVFFSKHALKRHVDRVHEEVKKFYHCPECNKKFKSKPHLNEHVRSHTQSFTCDVCGVSFSRLNSKQRHAKIHTGEKEHTCHICGHGFIQKTPFWVHMEKHHDLTKEQLKEMFPSQHGGRAYTLPESIKQLEIQTHVEDNNPSSVGNEYTSPVQKV